MMKLYFAKGSCSLVPRLIINEIGLRCEFESVNLKTKETETGKDFKKINPKGSVPVIEFNKGDVLTENSIILQFLADDSKSTQLLPPVGDFKRYRVLECLNYITTELHKGFGVLFNPAVPSEFKDKLFVPAIKTKFAFINEALEGKNFLVGEGFTLPDAYMFVVMLWAKNFKIDLSDCPNLNRYWDLLKKRPAFVRSLNEEGIDL